MRHFFLDDALAASLTVGPEPLPSTRRRPNARSAACYPHHPAPPRASVLTPRGPPLHPRRRPPPPASPPPPSPPPHPPPPPRPRPPWQPIPRFLTVTERRPARRAATAAPAWASSRASRPPAHPS